MCGIAGIWGEANEACIRRMTELVSHRGPDDCGVRVFQYGDIGVSLGHRRLSIIDLSEAGHEPMTNEDGTIWLVFNGEIYNFRDLRAELLGHGHVFRSATDAEVLIHAYEEWGTAFVAKLNGIFAFAIWDERKRRLHLARDRFGVKPLYYAQLGRRIIFASEIKALLCYPGIDRDLNRDLLSTYITFRYCPEPWTLFNRVRKVAPGEVMTVSQSGVSSFQVYELKFDVIENSEERELAAKLRELLAGAVARQMISDVPIGFFLSGGLDSSGLLAMARSQTKGSIQTFTVGFRSQDQNFERQPDDLEYAREVARYFGTHHHEIILEPKVIDLLPKVIWHLDEPIADPAAITSYLICEQARRYGVKVLLSGQGGDEVFCGYPWHLAVQIGRYYQHVPSALRTALEAMTFKLPGARGGAFAGTLRRIRKFTASASLPFEPQLLGYLSYASDENRAGLFSTDDSDSFYNGKHSEAHMRLLRDSAGWHYINQMLHLDMGTFLPSLNLAYTDKTSMAHGVEARVPYLDNEVVDFMAHVPPALKMRRLTRKHLLKLALGPMLPRRVIHRKKGGFGAPIRSWISRDLKPMIGDLLSPSQITKRGFFNPEYVQRLTRENASGRSDYSYLIYSLLSFELWYQAFVESDSSPHFCQPGAPPIYHGDQVVQPWK
jgi:asparagine synthase (glutamine-hydrolysing)